MSEKSKHSSPTPAPPPPDSGPAEVRDSALEARQGHGAIIQPPRSYPALRTAIRIGVLCLVAVGTVTVLFIGVSRPRSHRASRTRIMDDLQQLEMAVDLYTTEWGLTSGEPVNWEQVRAQIKAPPVPDQNSAPSATASRDAVVP